MEDCSLIQLKDSGLDSVWMLKLLLYVIRNMTDVPLPQIGVGAERADTESKQSRPR